MCCKFILFADIYINQDIIVITYMMREILMWIVVFFQKFMESKMKEPFKTLKLIILEII